MNTIKIAIFISLIILNQTYGHKIHKRLLENSKEQQGKEKDLINETKLEFPSTTTSVNISKEPVVSTQVSQNRSLISSTKAPETSEVHQSNKTDQKEFPADFTDEKVKIEKPQESTQKNSSTPEEFPSTLFRSIQKPIQIIKEDCTCFSIRRPNSVTKSTKLENSTTSILSEIESEMGLLFEIDEKFKIEKPQESAAGVFPSKVNDSKIFEGNINETSTSFTKATQTNSSEAKEVKNDEAPFFEDFIPFFPLDSFLSGVMPHDTIIIQTESEAVDASKLFPKLSDEAVKNGSTPIEMQQGIKLSNSSTQKIDKMEIKTPVSA